MIIKRGIFISALLAATSSFAISAPAIAAEKEDALIAKVVEAYGGDRLRNLRSVRIQDTFKTAFPGQGYTSGYVEFTPLKQDAQLDVVNERGSIEGWTANWNFMNNTRTVSAGDDIVTINYNTEQYQPAVSPDYYTAFGPAIRSSDTMLAYELPKRADSAEHQGEVIYIGRSHEIISFEIPNSPPLTLYVDSESGWISKMVRQTGFGDLTYLFNDHAIANGVGYGSNFEFFVGSDVNLLTISRTVSANSVRSSVFNIDRGIVEEPARVDASEMTIDEIDEGIHLAGTGNAYTLFVDACDYVIGVGGYAGLSARFDAYGEALGHNKPLRYQVVTHHHTDHLGGMADAFALGAIFITPENAVANIRTAVGEEVPDDRIHIINEKMTHGPVEVYTITTNHTESFALAYMPGAKVAFQADHYNGNYVDALSPAGASAVHLKKAIDALGVDVDDLLSAHGRKVITWEDFTSTVADYDPNPCQSGRAICR